MRLHEPERRRIRGLLDLARPELSMKMRAVRIGIGLLLTTLVGCASYTPRPLSPLDTAIAFEARSLDADGLKQFLMQNLRRENMAWPPASWDLPSLTLAALYFHTDLTVARAQWDVARAGEITAGTRPNPSLDLGPQYNSTAVDPSPWTIGFSFNLPLETAGKRGYRIAQARHLSETARLNIAATTWQVRARVRASLLKLHAGREMLAVQEKLLGAHAMNVRLLTRGRVAPLPNVTQARIALDQTRLAVHDAQRQAAEARAQLAAALGVPLDALREIDFSFEIFDPFTLPAPPPAATLRRQALQTRPEILAALAQYAATESALALAVAKQYPDIQLGPGYAWDQGDNKWSLGISFPFLLWHRNQGPIAEATARRREAAARFTALQARVTGEFDTALGGYRAALGKLDAAESLLSAQQRQYRTLHDMVRGEAGRFALINAELQLLAGELARLEAQVAAEQALGALEDAVERPLHPLDLSPLPPLTAHHETKDTP